MTEEEYAQLKRNVAGAKDRAKAFQNQQQTEPPKTLQVPTPHKYRAKPVKDPEDGYFHSTGEWQRWQQLKLLQQAGEIRKLQRQVTFKELAHVIVLTNAKEGIFEILQTISWKIDYTYEERHDLTRPKPREEPMTEMYTYWRPVAEEFTSGPTMTARKKLQIQAFRLKYPDWELRITDRRILS